MAHRTDSKANEENFEIIELAIDDVELLTRAFNLIKEVCEEKENPRLHLSSQAPRDLIN